MPKIEMRVRVVSAQFNNLQCRLELIINGSVIRETEVFDINETDDRYYMADLEEQLAPYFKS